MGTNSGYTRRQELRCTLEEMETYGSVILYEGEVIYVLQEDGSYAIKVGDGTTGVAALPYSVNYGEIMKVAEQIPEAVEAVEDAKTHANNAYEREKNALSFAQASYDHSANAKRYAEDAENAKIASEVAAGASEAAAAAVANKLAEANGKFVARNIAYEDSLGVVGATDVQGALDSIAHSFNKISALDELKGIEDWATVKELVDHGLAPYVFEVGHKFTDKMADGITGITWRVVNVTINEMKLQCVDVCTRAGKIPWHKNWPDNNGQVVSYKDSRVREYMTSTFPSLLAEDFANIVANSNIPLWIFDESRMDYLPDKFFIPSVDELYGDDSYRTRVEEGLPDKYYIDATGWEYPSNGITPVRENIENYWTRSHHPGGEAAVVAAWNGAGYITNGTTSSVNGGYCILPTCIIRREITSEE